VIERIRQRLRAEGGFTLVEVMIATLLTAIGTMALVTGFDSSREMVNLAERNEAATHQAEKELERIMAMDYSAVALTATPTASSNKNNPAYYVNGGNYTWDQDASPRTEALVVDAVNGQIEPIETWSDGRLSGEIHVFTTHVYDQNLQQAGTDQPDARRVTVAVTVNGEGGPEKPVLNSSIAFDRGPTP
jgi:Tfp pilus assembly protein PilV